ncbi:unnamed protein product [Bemisia tabaci]|uniref:Uncharacterized protein n=1 Tax=Bemisia tabaci TaxID=7038 RepID=A0A9P0EXH0_BEMTA|nr:unnamed protein product [Bemisia tabaci]
MGLALVLGPPGPVHASPLKPAPSSQAADEFKRNMLHFNDTPPGIFLKSPKIISGRPKIFPSRIRRFSDTSSFS